MTRALSQAWSLYATAYEWAKDFPDQVSAFEAVLIVEIGERFMRFGRAAAVSAAEEAVLSHVVQGLEQHARRLGMVVVSDLAA